MTALVSMVVVAAYLTCLYLGIDPPWARPPVPAGALRCPSCGTVAALVVEDEARCLNIYCGVLKWDPLGRWVY